MLLSIDAVVACVHDHVRVRAFSSLFAHAINRIPESIICIIRRALARVRFRKGHMRFILHLIAIVNMTDTGIDVSVL
jgi:hypothetical protein